MTGETVQREQGRLAARGNIGNQRRGAKYGLRDELSSSTKARRLRCPKCPRPGQITDSAAVGGVGGVGVGGVGGGGVGGVGGVGVVGGCGVTKGWLGAGLAGMAGLASSLSVAHPELPAHSQLGMAVDVRIKYPSETAVASGEPVAFTAPWSIASSRYFR